MSAQFGAVRRLKYRSLLLALIACTLLLIVGSNKAWAGHYHTNCVGHGLVHGSSTTDGAVHSRVEAGCGNPGQKNCKVRVAGYYDSNGNPVNFAWEWVAGGANVTCNAFSNLGAGKEQISHATVDFDGVFASHAHYAH